MNPTLANKTREVIFIGLPGPTHHYGGLSADNIASGRNRGSVSNPRQAALQVVSLVRLLMRMGIAVAIVPPQLRPHLPELKKHFAGDDADTIAQAAIHNPRLLEAMSSSASMWTANAATVTPSVDSDDGTLHVTIANLHTNPHRRIEALSTYLLFRQIFSRVPQTVVHMPLDADYGFRDEGAANHMRLAPSHSALGLHVLVYGTDGNPRDPKTARQTLSVSQEIIRKHHLNDEAAIVIKQNPLAIEQGVFHNDVIAVSNEQMLLVHAEAFALGMADIAFIADSYAARTGQALTVRTIASHELSVEEAVATYFFNSQMVTMPDGEMAFIAPIEVKELYGGKAAGLLQSMIDDGTNPIAQVEYVDLRQSMRNGGGPACLRLRVPMNEEQLSAFTKHSGVLANEALLSEMEAIITRRYRQELYACDIDYSLYLECKEVLQAMGAALNLDLLSASSHQ